MLALGFDPGQWLCACGCNQPTSLATKTDSSTNRIKGQPMKFISGHNTKLRKSFTFKKGQKPHWYKNGFTINKRDGRATINCRDNKEQIRWSRIVYANYYLAGDVDLIPKGYDVHHKNEDYLDDCPKNLELKSKSSHGYYHSRKKKVLLTKIGEMPIIGESARAISRQLGLRYNAVTSALYAKCKVKGYTVRFIV